MKAIVQDRYGSPDVLQLREVDAPVIGDDEVLVRVHAAGVDQGVWHVMAGLPYLIRLAGYGIRAPKNPVPGADLAGVVETVGKGVTWFQPGDEFGSCSAMSSKQTTKSPKIPAIRKPTRGFEPRTSSLRVTVKEGNQSSQVSSGPANKPKPRTPKESEEPETP